jgi:hypothetical protein
VRRHPTLIGDDVFVAAMLEKKISRFEKENLGLTTLLQDVTGQGLAAITSCCRQPVFGWESQVLHPEVLRPCTDRLNLSLRLMYSACANCLRIREVNFDKSSKFECKMRNFPVWEFKLLKMQARNCCAGGAETGMGRARSS